MARLLAIKSRKKQCMKQLIIIFLSVIISNNLFSQDLNRDEKKLYELMMDYRKSKGQAVIPISKSLTIVAQTHAQDLVVNNPIKNDCNMHSWSAKGNWKALCYTANHANAEGMWNKPRELTNYQGNGYEIAYWHSAAATAFDALASWKTSAGHNALIINNGIWKTSKWNAIGIGIYKNYAVVWFGEEADN